MVLKEPFTTASPVLANYSFTDISSGTGYTIFYAGKTIDDELLTNFTYYSDTIFTAANMGVSADAKRLDVDFDVLVNTTMTLEGIGIVNVPIAARRSGTTTTAYVIVKLRKWDGTTETEIASNTSKVLTNNSVSVKYTMTATDLTIPATTFTQGDYIRLTIELWGAGGSSPSSVEFAHDPKGRTTGWDTTVSSILTAQIPFRLDV